MNIYIKCSLHRIKHIVRDMPQEVEVNLTTTLRKKLVREPVLRYAGMDYICRRIHVDNVVFQATHARTDLVLPISDYWLRSLDDPRVKGWDDVKLVIKLW